MPVTQLYVSVDASTKDSLKKIDRPLFKDFWPRFIDSLKALGEKVSCMLSLGFLSQEIREVRLGSRGFMLLRRKVLLRKKMSAQTNLPG